MICSSAKDRCCMAATLLRRGSREPGPRNADAPLIPIYLKPWGVRRRTYRATISRGRTVFFVGATQPAFGARMMRRAGLPAENIRRRPDEKRRMGGAPAKTIRQPRDRLTGYPQERQHSAALTPIPVIRGAISRRCKRSALSFKMMANGSVLVSAPVSRIHSGQGW
jgi:hypothetical protein